jgi:hypothetical protein
MFMFSMNPFGAVESMLSEGGEDGEEGEQENSEECVQKSNEEML